MSVQLCDNIVCCGHHALREQVSLDPFPLIEPRWMRITVDLPPDTFPPGAALWEAQEGRFVLKYMWPAGSCGPRTKEFLANLEAYARAVAPPEPPPPPPPRPRRL